ncbi:hypothetical protein ABC502_09985 [Alkalimonas sp. NCh-2]|uniref:hypothetical protein n=1 Tax=Alkalimonas sp. NCh-2 TaxID=3144846 RepID=UPI0031F6E24F
MTEDITTSVEKKMEWYEHLACGWPLILIFIGGALGGLCGGAAYAVNAKVFGRDISNTKKYVYAILIGVSAFLTYFVAVVILAMIFP